MIIDTTFVRNPYGGSGSTGSYTPFPGIAATQSDRPGKNIVFNVTKIISPSVVNQFNFAYARRYFNMSAVSDQANRATLGLTIPELFPENKGDLIPIVSYFYAGNYEQKFAPRTNGAFSFDTASMDAERSSLHTVLSSSSS